VHEVIIDRDFVNHRFADANDANALRRDPVFKLGARNQNPT